MCIASVDAAERDPTVVCSTALEVHVTIMHYTNLHFTYYSGGLGAPPQWGSVAKPLVRVSRAGFAR